MEVPMDEIKKLTLPKQLLAGGGVLLFIFSFFDWFSIGGGRVGSGAFSYAIPEYSANAWETEAVGFFFGVLPVLAGLAAAALVLLPVFGVKLPDGAPWEMITAICGCVGALVVIELLKGESPADRAFGLIVAAIAGAAMCAGGVMTLMNQNKSAS